MASTVKKEVSTCILLIKLKRLPPRTKKKKCRKGFPETFETNEYVKLLHGNVSETLPDLLLLRSHIITRSPQSQR